ncbi:MAG TPA: hypothetical protein VM010_03990 [Chitinophagaceae bacterium]|nr:hypothetical protein [Chitinophagaceae bacterium]
MLRHFNDTGRNSQLIAAPEKNISKFKSCFTDAWGFEKVVIRVLKVATGADFNRCATIYGRFIFAGCAFVFLIFLRHNRQPIGRNFFKSPYQPTQSRLLKIQVSK